LTDSPEHGGKGMTFDSVLTQIFTTLIGGGGIMGIMFYYLKRYIDKRITAEEKEASERAEIRTRRLTVEHKLRHAYGRVFFWMHKAITKPPHNGELEEAMRLLQDAEAENKALDQEIISKFEKE